MADEPIDIMSLTPEQATAKLNEMTAAYRGALPSENPQTAAEAGARLAALGQDPAWSAKLFAGNAEANREFHRLSQMIANGDRTTDALAGIEPRVSELTSGKELNTRNLTTAVRDLREMGLDEDVIRMAIEGLPADTTPEQAAIIKQAALERRREILGTPELRQRYLEKDPELVKNMAATAIALGSDIAEK
jgi:hypothetical protein